MAMITGKVQIYESSTEKESASGTVFARKKKDGTWVSLKGKPLKTFKAKKFKIIKQKAS